MAYRELTMIDVKEVLRRWTAGQTDRQIARDTGTARKTVTRYVAMAEALGVGAEHPLDDAAVHEVAQAVQARPVMDQSEGWAEVAQHRARITDWLEQKRPLRLTNIHALLTRDHGDTASYATLGRFAIQELGWTKKKPTPRLDDPPPAQEAQVDFGKMGTPADPETGNDVRAKYEFLDAIDANSVRVIAACSKVWLQVRLARHSGASTRRGSRDDSRPSSSCSPRVTSICRASCFCAIT